jgi:hypothetical protein
MKTKHKYILTLSTLALFVIYVFIGYFISTAVVTKAPLPEGGGCPYIECIGNSDPKCENTVCNNMKGRCEYSVSNKKWICSWASCKDTDQCVSLYCCESEAGQPSNSQCFKEGIYTNDKYLCAPK